ncbi:MAG: aminopeptidase [Clostridia bacterium]|nr:aminopeptidase [Clostridia bacterium]
MSEKLLTERKHAFLQLTDEEVKLADDFCEGYKNFLDEAKTEREAVDYAVAAAEANGFVPFDYTAKYNAGDKVYVNVHGKSIMLAVIGKNGTKNGVRISAAHIDAPRVDLKPIPLYEANDTAMFKTHYYGGIRKYQWVATPIAMHGVFALKNGEVIKVRIGEDDKDPVFCITDLLPHLAQEQVTKTLAAAFTGEDLNITVGSRPVRDEDEKKAFKMNVMKLLNDKYGITEDDFLSAEIEFVPAFKSRDVGFDRSLIGAYGHDDRVCSYPALQAIFDCGVPEDTCITVLADKEEIGSTGNTGLQGHWLAYFVEDLAKMDGLEGRHVLCKSTCLSADVTAAYDPNYPSAFEANNSAYVNYGVGVSKYTGSRGKSGTNDCNAEFVAKVRKVFDDAGVIWQMAELGRVDLGGGGTVALLISKLGVDTIDVGVPVLSMHSPFEMVSKLDVYEAYKGFKAFFVN